MNAAERPARPAQRLACALERRRQRYRPADLERLEHALAIAEGRTPMPSLAEYQRPVLLCVPGLEARPLHDAASFPATSVLRAACVAIVDEARHVSASGRGWERLNAGAASFTVKEGCRVPEHVRALMPATVDAVERLPGAGDMAMLSRLGPGGRVPPHTGPYNFRLTIHLALWTNDLCRYRVGPERTNWKEGECLVFDDSFEHESWNDGTDDRMILLADLWHPGLSPLEVEVLVEVV